MSIFGGIMKKSGSSEVNAAKQQRTIDRTIASGQRARAKADRASAKADSQNVKNDIQRKNGFKHGMVIGIYNVDSKKPTKPSNNGTRSRGSKR